MSDRVAAFVTQHSRVAIVVLLLVTAGLTPGMAAINETGAVSGLTEESAAADAQVELRERFSGRGVNTTTTLIVVSSDADNVLSREQLLAGLEYQQTLRTNRTVNRTLVDDEPTVGIANIVARAAIAADRRGTLAEPTITGWNETTGVVDANETAAEWETPTLEAQIEQLESMNNSEVSTVVERVVDPNSSSEAGRLAGQLLPKNYTPGSTEADDRLLVMTQQTDGQVGTAAGLSAAVSESQAAARSIATAQPGDVRYYVYGAGLVNHEQDQVIADSFGILGPLALLFVVLALAVAYRDLVDVGLGLIGVVVVLLWTFGAMGWLGIDFNPMMIALPIILIGLAVDFGLHITMRYREKRQTHAGVRPALASALSGLGPALVLITVTTGIGFLSNYTSPLGDIRAFGLATTIGITATLFVFGVLMPAVKAEISSLLARRGWDRTPSLPGSTRSVRRLLTGGARVATRAPFVVLVVTLLITGGAAYGATELQLSAEQELFMGDDPPELAENLLESLEPGDYSLKEDRRYVFSTFQSPERQGYVLVTGNVTRADTLDRIAAAERAAAGSPAVYTGWDGTPEVVTPLSEMRAVAAEHPGFNRTLAMADSSGDGVPDRNLGVVYDEFYEVAPDRASSVIDRSDDGYTALQLRISTDGSADRSAAVTPVTEAAATVDNGGDRQAVATGVFLIEEQLNEKIASSLIQSLTLTLLTILLLLAVAFRITTGSLSLGIVTLVPVVLSACWLFGTMALLGIPISLITAMVGSITVGIGVDYAIHVSERYSAERETAEVGEALGATVVGTGSALLSSAVTTALGFGVLAFALLPALRQFGFVLALGVVYSFITTVYVQPTLLALWERYLSADVVETQSPATSESD